MSDDPHWKSLVQRLDDLRLSLLTLRSNPGITMPPEDIDAALATVDDAAEAAQAVDELLTKYPTS